MSTPARRRRRDTNTWPGFVDALASLLMVIIFVLMIFVTAQFYLTQILSGKDETLAQLARQVSELSDLLDLEREANADLRLTVAQLSAELQGSLATRDQLSARIDRLNSAQATLESRLADLMGERAVRQGRIADLETARRGADSRLLEVLEERDALLGRLAETEESLRTATAERDAARERARSARSELRTAERALESERAISNEAQNQVALLNAQILALRQQLARIELALEASERENEEQSARIVDLGRRLNAALASKVQELARFRSEFFGRLREVLAGRQDIRIVGDRFVFQSEVLFGSGSADIGEAGARTLEQLAAALIEIAGRIPPDINWILQIEGHTDTVPIFNEQFADNWELSAARAISVVEFLIERGIPPERLSATGYSEFQPIDPSALERNRRIELKLTQR